MKASASEDGDSNDFRLEDRCDSVISSASYLEQLDLHHHPQSTPFTRTCYESTSIISNCCERRYRTNSYIRCVGGW